MAQIVILGGGIGGLSTALKIRKRLPLTHQVIVIDRNNPQYFPPALIWLSIGKKNEKEIYRSLSNLHHQGIEFINEEAIKVDTNHKRVITKKNSITFDILVLATGADYNSSSYPLLQKTGYNLYNLDDVKALKKAITNFSGGNIVLLVANFPIKCPPAIYEEALLLENYFRKKGLEGKFNITICTPASKPLSALGSEMAQKILKTLQKRKIRVYPGLELEKNAAKEKQLIFKDKIIPYDLLIYIPPHQGTKVIKNSNLGNDGGWIPTDPYLLTAGDNIFALGDATIIKTPSGKVLPKAGVIATLQSFVVSENVVSLVNGKKPEKRYSGFFGCILDIGGGKTMAGLGNLYNKKGITFKFLPTNRIWSIGKKAIEYNWLHKGEPVY